MSEKLIAAARRVLDEPCQPKGPWRAHNDVVLTERGGLTERVCDMRGWGRLTGHGALNLSRDKAARIQDELAEFIALCDPQTILDLAERAREGEERSAADPGPTLTRGFEGGPAAQNED